MYGWLIYDRAGRERNRWFIDEMLRCAGSLGETLRLIEAEKLRFGVRGGELHLDLPEGKAPDYAIVRTIFPMLSQALEAIGVKTFNNAEVSATANDKRRVQALCAKLGVPTPDTVFFNRYCFDPEVCEYPAVLKSADGHGGNEVFYVENAKSAAAAVEKLGTSDFLMQEPVDKGRDVRLYMLGGKLLSAVERTSKTDFRSNYSLGGECRLFEPTSEMLDAADAICRALDPTFIGVDFIFRNGKPLLNEIEDVVGARMLYRLTELPVHRRFFDTVMREMRDQ